MDWTHSSILAWRIQWTEEPGGLQSIQSQRAGHNKRDWECTRTHIKYIKNFQAFSSVQSLSHVQFFATPWTTARQASLSITNSQSLLKLIFIESVMHPTISSSVIPFSFCFQSFPVLGSLFKWPCSSHQVAKVLEFHLQHQSFQWNFRTDFL